MGRSDIFQWDITGSRWKWTENLVTFWPPFIQITLFFFHWSINKFICPQIKKLCLVPSLDCDISLTKILSRTCLVSIYYSSIQTKLACWRSNRRNIDIGIILHFYTISTGCFLKLVAIFDLIYVRYIVWWRHFSNNITLDELPPKDIQKRNP